MVNRKVKRKGKEERLIEKLGEAKYNFSYNVNTQPLPSWSHAFDYAYDLRNNELIEMIEYRIKTLTDARDVLLKADYNFRVDDYDIRIDEAKSLLLCLKLKEKLNVSKCETE